MKASALNLIPRKEFQEFSLKEKNVYLQGIADSYAQNNQLEPILLDKDALSRLRRYYSRRVWADLKLENAPDTLLNQSLERLGEAIRNSEIAKDVKGALAAEGRPRRILRPPPGGDEQFMFFVPSIYDAPIKDDVNLMDIAPFALNKRAAPGVIKYELKDSLITVEGGTESGIATVFDYDIFLNMVSYLNEEFRQYKIDQSKGLKPSLPPRSYRPNASHILKFCRRSKGAKSYEGLEAALDRLQATNIKVVNLGNGKRREVDSRSLIEGYSVVSKTTTGKIDLVEIRIPDWVYNSIVVPDASVGILTLHEDYFLIESGLGRFIYRLSRKAAGETTATYSFEELHRRSGSRQEFRKFAYDLRKFVSHTQVFPLPGYDLKIVKGKRGDMLQMDKRAGEPEEELIEDALQEF